MKIQHRFIMLIVVCCVSWSISSIAAEYDPIVEHAQQKLIEISKFLQFKNPTENIVEFEIHLANSFEKLNEEEQKQLIETNKESRSKWPEYG